MRNLSLSNIKWLCGGICIWEPNWFELKAHTIMLCYIPHQHKSSPSPFPIGKRLSHFPCQELTFTSHKVTHFWWQMCMTYLHLNEEERIREREGLEKREAWEENRATAWTLNKISTVFWNLHAGKALNLSESQSSHPAKKMMMQVSASPWDGHCHLPSLIFHSWAYFVSGYSFHLNFLLERALRGGAKLHCNLIFHGTLNPSYHLI